MRGQNQYPYLPIFPRIRGVFLLNEQRDIIYSTPKRKKMEKLLPGLLHAAASISGRIGGERAHKITTGKLKIHIIKEEEPFPYFTAIVVNKEASEQVGMWAVYLSKLIATVLFEHGITKMSDKAQKIIGKTLSREINLTRVPDRAEVIKFISKVYKLLYDKLDSQPREIRGLRKTYRKREKNTQDPFSKFEVPKRITLGKVFNLIENGEIYKAFFITSQKKRDKFILLQAALGLLLKNLHYQATAPSLTEIENFLQEVDEKEYPTLLTLLRLSIKKLSSTRECIRAYTFLKKGVGRRLSELQLEGDEYKLKMFNIILRGLTSIFYPVEKEALDSLTKDTKIGENTPITLWWEPGIVNENLYNPILPHLLMRGFNWQEFQPFYHSLLERTEKTRGKINLRNRKKIDRNLHFRKVHLNKIRASFGFFAISITRTYNLKLSDKEKLGKIFKEKLRNILNNKKEILAYVVPLAHLGIASINANQFVIDKRNSHKTQWKEHGKKAIREVLELNKNNRIGDLLELVILLMSLDVLYLKVDRDKPISPEVVTALDKITSQEGNVMRILEEITSPYYFRRVLLSIGLSLLLKSGEYKEHKDVTREGISMLKGFVPRLMMRGGFTWDILANLWQFEKEMSVIKEEVKYSLITLATIFQENNWKPYGWKPWASNELLETLKEFRIDLPTR